MNAMLSVFCLVAAVLSSVSSAPYLNYYYSNPYNYAAYRNALYGGLAPYFSSAAPASVVAAAAAPAAAVVPAAATAPVVPAATALAVVPPVNALDAYSAALRYLQYGYGYGYGYPYTAPYAAYPFYKKK